ADLSTPLGEHIDALLDAFGLLVEEKMVAAKVWAADMPVEVLGFHVERESVRKERVERGGDLGGRVRREVRRRFERCWRLAHFKLFDFVAHSKPRAGWKSRRGGRRLGVLWPINAPRQRPFL